CCFARLTCCISRKVPNGSQLDSFKASAKSATHVRSGRPSVNKQHHLAQFSHRGYARPALRTTSPDPQLDHLQASPCERFCPRARPPIGCLAIRERVHRHKVSCLTARSTASSAGWAERCRDIV